MMADWMPTLMERGSAQGADLDVKPHRRSAGPRFSWFVSSLVMGDWKTPLVLVAAALGLAWCFLFWPWFRNQPEDMAQVNRAEERADRLCPARAS